MRTYFPKQGDIEPKWFIIDAEGKVLGRLSTEIARIISDAAFNYAQQLMSAKCRHDGQ